MPGIFIFMLIDSHCHLDRIDLAPHQGQLGRALDVARSHGVGHFLCVAVDLPDWHSMVRQVEDFSDVSVSVGVHPSVPADRILRVDKLVQLARHPRVVAIGETGLDYYYGKGQEQHQQQRFRTHIAAAREVGKPLIIHCRDAWEDTLGILREENGDRVGGVMHCFTGDWEVAQQVLELNFYVSFSGIVTFKSARSIQDVARRIPADRMLVETDSPYLAPVPYRGKSNQPAWVRYVAEQVAVLRGESLETVAGITTANYFRLFGGG